MSTTYQTLLVERADGYLIAQINRPEALNALNNQVMDDLKAVVAELEGDPDLRCLILTGNERAFAAGADIGEMSSRTYAEMVSQNLFTRNWDALGQCRKPIIAAVAGFALGGGCEIAMMCDIILAADTARFGQPEINLAVAPGAGGTQRLPRAIGKAKTMDLVLTGRMMDAEEAERSGLVSRVVPADRLMDEARAIAAKIARLSPIAVMLNKEMVGAAFETPLAQGLKLERRLFHSLFAFEDQKEGMAAFVEKRKPDFKGR